MSRRRMHHHPLRFIDQNNIGVFIQDIQIHLLRNDFGLYSLRNLQFDQVSGRRLIIALNRLSAYKYSLCLQKLLKIRPGELRTPF